MSKNHGGDVLPSRMFTRLMNPVVDPTPQPLVFVSKTELDTLKVAVLFAIRDLSLPLASQDADRRAARTAGLKRMQDMQKRLNAH